MPNQGNEQPIERKEVDQPGMLGPLSRRLSLTTNPMGTKAVRGSFLEQREAPMRSVRPFVGWFRRIIPSIEDRLLVE